MQMPYRTALFTFALMAIAASPARAATVTATASHVDGYKGSGYEDLELTVVAAPGEANRVTVGGALGGLLVTDDGAPLTAGAGCAASGTGVVCTAPGPSTVSAGVKVVLGDGDDTAIVRDVPSPRVEGDDGDDTLIVSGGATGYGAALLGGPGADVLTGGGGADTLDGGPGPDRMSGGAGDDTVPYRDRTAPVTAVIGTGGNGEAGEGDVIGADVETLVGGAGDDVLVGTDAANGLAGGPGDDHLDGRGGGDRLVGGTPLGQPPYDEGSTADVVLGGDGDDTLATGPHGRIDAGAGDDQLTVHGAARAIAGLGRDAIMALGPRGGATLDAGEDGERDVLRCVAGAPAAHETLDAHDVPLGCGHPPRRAGAGRLALLTTYMEDYAYVTVACPDDARRCATAVTVRAAGHVLARTRRPIVVRSGRQQQLHVPATRFYAHSGIPDGATLTTTATARARDGRLHTEQRRGCVDPTVASGPVEPAACRR